jgi:hypothetical protein
MKSELEKAEKALGVAVDALKSVSQGSCPGWLRTECYDAMEKVAAILNPPPVYEEIPLERWAVVAPSGYIEQTFGAEGNALDAAALPKYGQGYSVAKLTGTLRREKVAPVEHFAFASVTGEDFGPTGTIKVQMNDYNDAYRLRNKRISITW